MSVTCGKSPSWGHQEGVRWRGSPGRGLFEGVPSRSSVRGTAGVILERNPGRSNLESDPGGPPDVVP